MGKRVYLRVNWGHSIRHPCQPKQYKLQIPSTGKRVNMGKYVQWLARVKKYSVKFPSLYCIFYMELELKTEKMIFKN